MMRYLSLLLFLAVLGAGCASTDVPESEFEADDYLGNALDYYEHGDYSRALQQFEKVLAIDEDNERALLGRAWSLLFVGETQILRLKKDGPEHIQLARDYLEELLEVDLEPNDYKVRLGLGKAHQILSDLYARRVALIQSEMERWGPDPSRAGALAKAEAEQARETAEAEKYLSEVLTWEGNPAAKDDLTALVILAKFSADRGDYESTILYCARFLEQVRRSKTLWNDAIRKYPEDTELWEERLTRAVLKEIPARWAISNAFYKIGHFAEAEEQLHEILLLNDQLLPVYLDRAVVREARDNKLAALEDYKRFLRGAVHYDLSTDDPRVQAAARRVVALENELYATEGGAGSR